MSRLKAVLAMDGLALVVVIGALALYFLPAFIGAMRGVAHHNGIIAINLFLGWTVIGWLAALIWACTDEKAADPARRNCPWCDESISQKASVCPHCRREVAAQPA